MPPHNEVASDENGNRNSDLDMATEKLLPRLADIAAEDHNFGEALYIKCWLTLGKHNTDKTEKLIREAIKWRIEQNTEEAIKSPLNPSLEQSVRVYLDGTSKNGFLVASAYLGIFKLRETIGKHGVEGMMYHWMQILGHAEKICIQRTKVISNNNKSDDTRSWPALRKSWLILNAKNFSYLECMNTGVIQMAIALVKIATCYFPGLEGTIVIVNAGRVVEFLLKTLRPLLVGTNADVVVFGTDESVWKAFIHKHVDPDQLRIPFGGTMEYYDVSNPDKEYT